MATRDEQLNVLLENAIYRLSYLKRKITQVNARFLYALVRQRHAPLLACAAPYLPRELGGTHGQPSASLDDAVHDALCAELSARLEQLFRAFPTHEAKRLSKHDRTTLGLCKSSLTYGEVGFEALAAVLYAHVPLPPGGGVFVDLGSGSGRGVLAAAMLHHWHRCAGIEVLPSLHEAALSVSREYAQKHRVGNSSSNITNSSVGGGSSGPASGGDETDTSNVVDTSGLLPVARTPRRFGEQRSAALARRAAKWAAEDADDAEYVAAVAAGMHHAYHSQRAAGADSDSAASGTDAELDDEAVAAFEAAYADSQSELQRAASVIASAATTTTAAPPRMTAREALQPGTVPPPVEHAAPTEPTQIQFVCGDFLHTDWWTAADVVFANSTCFDDALMRALGACGARMKKGSHFLTLTKPLHSFHFARTHQGVYQMSWGTATIYVHRKLTEPNEEAPA